MFWYGLPQGSRDRRRRARTIDLSASSVCGYGPGMPSIDTVADAYVERAIALDPLLATYAGIAGHDHELAGPGPGRVRRASAA